MLQDLRILIAEGWRTRTRIGNFKLERGFRGGRLSAWNLKIMRVLILRCLGRGNCLDRLVMEIELVSFFARMFNG